MRRQERIVEVQVHVVGKSPDSLIKAYLISGESQTRGPVSREDAERRRLVANVVHLSHGIGNAALGHHLLILSGGALEGFPHVDVLKRNWEEDKKKKTPWNDCQFT